MQVKQSSNGISAEEKRLSTEAIRQNIDLICKLEEQFLANRSGLDRLADWIGDLSGSIWFVLVHGVLAALYFWINTAGVPGLPKFDPYPFQLLSMIVSVESIFLATFVLIKQNRMSRRADSRAHLDLQINLLAEKEMTLVLQMLHVIGKRLGVEDRFETEQVAELSETTSIEEMANELNEKLPE